MERSFVTNGYYRDYTNLDFINSISSEKKEQAAAERCNGDHKEMPSSNVV